MPADSAAAAPSRENVASVYRRIRRMILSGKFKGGQAISQVQLALDFETSRGPVREALRMLQREGLIEAETNQRGRIVTFSAADLEQVCALLALNVTAATRAGADRFTAQDIRRIGLVIDRIEALAPVHPNDAGRRATERRQLAFRKLIRLSCRYAGPYIAQTIDELLDRVAMFRQLHDIMGVSPPYPLASRFAELRDAAERGDALEMAHVLLDKIADVSRKALKYVSEGHQPRLLDAYVAMARETLPAPPGGGSADSVSAAAGVTIRVRSLPDGRLACEVLQD